MKLTILGKYGAYPFVGGACSGYLIEDEGHKILIDCGPGVFSRIEEFVKIKELDCVILSHLHQDHMSDMGVLRYYLEVNDLNMKLYCPNEPIDEVNKLSRDSFSIEHIDENKVIRIGELEFRFTKTVHPILTFGIGIYKEGRKILHYTSDTQYFDRFSNDVNNAHFMLADGVCLDKNSVYSHIHICLSDLVKVAKENNSKLLLTHVGNEDEEIYKALKSLISDGEVVKERKTYILE